MIQTPSKESATGGNVEFVGVHGATDAPAVDIVARGVATLVNNAMYGDITGYIAVPPAKYTLDVKDSTGTTRVATFAADLSGLANGAAVVFASGFLTPSANQNGKAFGLYAALANGTVVAFPAVTTARLQVIHNAADPAADRWISISAGNEALDNFGFRKATPLYRCTCGRSQSISALLCASTSASAADTIQELPLDADAWRNLRRHREWCP